MTGAMMMVMILLAIIAFANARSANQQRTSSEDVPLTYGPRPFWLIDEMSPGTLKAKLQSCAMQTPTKSVFSIGHRGAPLQFPEHTKESYVAAARMGAGSLECNVTFTKDRQLVCRHSQCDLHTTTNVLLTPLARKCTEPFKPAVGDAPASALCCTSDFTLAEFRSLTGKMDASYPPANTVEEYVTLGTAAFRTDLYASSGTLMTHNESVALFRSLGVHFTPELKTPTVRMPFNGLSRAMYAQMLVDEYVSAGVDPRDVWLQSFDLDDVRYWLRNAPAFARQAVYLDDRYSVDGFDPSRPSTISPSFADLYRAGVRVIAPPIWVLLAERKGNIVISEYASAAAMSGLQIITWSAERSGAPPSGFYVQSYKNALKTDGDIFQAIHVLASKVKVLGIFSDWPSTITYYANCFGM